MTQEELLQAIEKAAREGANKLDLARNNLTTLPVEICQLQNLSVLDLGGNQLKSLPAEIAQLQNLSELYLTSTITN